MNLDALRLVIVLFPLLSCAVAFVVGLLCAMVAVYVATVPKRKDPAPFLRIANGGNP